MKKFLIIKNRENELVQKQTRVLCTISSGQDSISSFFSLLHEKKRFDLEILYCQHFWQTQNFFSVILIYKISFLFEIPYNIILPESLLLTENLSRGWRKKNFYRVAKIENRLKVVTGQTLTDNLEKFLNNLIRGTTSKSFFEPTLLNYKKTTTSFFSTLNLKPSFSRNFDQNGFFLVIISRKKSKNKKKNNFSTKKKIPLKLPRYSFLKKVFNLNWKNRQFLKTKGKGTRTHFNFFKTQKNQNPITCFLNLEKRRKRRKTNSTLLKPFLSKPPSSCSFCFYSNSLQLQILYKKPILDKKRITIAKLVTFYSLPIVNDVTNYSPRFSRNKIRHKLFPVMRSLFTQQFENLMKNFLKTGELEKKILQLEILEIYFLLKNQELLKLKQKKIAATDRDFFLSHVIVKKSGMYRSLLQQIFSEYSDIELTYLQIYSLNTFLVSQ